MKGSGPQSDQLPGHGASDLRSETIILATQDYDHSSEDPGPETVRATLFLHNRLLRIETKLIFFNEHYLACRARRKKRWRHVALFNLRYLDARPRISRAVDPRPLKIAGGAALAACLAATLAIARVAPVWTVPAALVSASLAAGALFVYARRNIERVSFFTAEGRAPALSLRANLGCIRACRRIVPEVSQAITAARRSVSLDRNTYLRREMREHYRLLETGSISQQACDTGTRRILSRFE